MDLKTFYQECVKRKVFKGISIYAISSWLIIQVAATTFPYLGFPAETVTTVIILVLLCFPVSIIFSWYYNVVPEPEETDTDKPSVSKKQKESNRLFFIVISIITVLMIVVIFMVSRKNFNPKEAIPVLTELVSDQIAVLQFNNNSSDESLDVVGKMVADWIAHGIIQYEVAPVMNYESINQFAAMGNGSEILEGSLSALGRVASFSKMIRGAYFLNGDDLVFQSEIIDKSTGEQFAFPQVTCPKDKPLDGVETIKQQILSYFLGPKQDVSGQYVPLYDAYKEFILARDYWRDDYDLANYHLDQSLGIDSNFYRAAYYKTMLHYNNYKDYNVVDSLINLYTKRYQGVNHDEEWFEYLDLILKGKYVEGVKKYEKLFRQQPSDIYDNGAMMVCQYNLLNQTSKISEIYGLINENEVDYEKCSYCPARTRIKVLAEIEQGNFEEASLIAERKSVLHSDRRFAEVMIKAYVFSSKIMELENYFNSRTYKLFSLHDQGYLQFTAGREFSLIGDKINRNKYTELALIKFQETKNLNMLARCYYQMENYDKAIEYFKEKNVEWQASHNGDSHTYSLSRIAGYLLMRNQVEEANKLIEQIKLQKGEYDFGRTSYLIAHAYAKAGNKERTLEMLEQSLLEGQRYGNLYFQNDPDLKEYFEDPGFKKLLTYWH